MQPLNGIRVLDLTGLLPGPWCTMMLGDLGAEVVKIENPAKGGDNSRHSHPRYPEALGGQSIYFCNINRNKSSVLIDLKDASGRDDFLDRVASADVVIESFRPGVADRLGIGYEACRTRNPAVVYCSLSGYGQTSPRRNLGGHDLNIAGMSGLLQSSAGSPPVMPKVLMGDYAGASAATIAILGALTGRARNGNGACIDVSMLEALMSWTGVQIANIFAALTGADETAVEGWGGNPRYCIYRTRDGRYVTVSLLEKRYWDAFCREFGRPDLINEEETEADRLTGHGEHGAAYRSFLENLFLTDDRDAWAERCQALNLPVCPVLTLEEVQANRAADGEDPWFLDCTAPGVPGAHIPQLGFAFRMRMQDGSDGLAIRRSPPLAGEGDVADWEGRSE